MSQSTYILFVKVFRAGQSNSIKNFLQHILGLQAWSRAVQKSGSVKDPTASIFASFRTLSLSTRKEVISYSGLKKSLQLNCKGSFEALLTPKS